MRRIASALTLALLLLTLVATSASAVDWDGERKLSSTLTADHELGRTGPRSALMLWQPGGSLLIRRTLDGGRTWLPSQTVATRVGLGSSVAAVGSRVDVVYVRSTTCPSSGESASRLFHRRSADGGATWTAPVALTSACSIVVEPDVARSGDGQVSIAWTGLLTGRILTRTSRDGGVTFGSAIHVATTTNRDFDVSQGGGRCCHIAKPEVAIGSGGTTYVAYISARDTISIRRSTNRGTTWSAARVLTTAGLEWISLVATGARAVVGYEVFRPSPRRAVYRTTADRGTTWSSQRSVVSVPNRQFSSEPEFAYQGGVLAAIFKFGPPGDSPIWYRESTDFGATWSARTRVSVEHAARADPEPAGVALLEGTALAGYAENGDTTGLWVRRGDR